MLVQVNYGDIQKSDALEKHVHDQIDSHLGHLAEHLTRIEVHLRDDNSASKSAANDKRCVMEARPAGLKPLAIDHAGDDIYTVIQEAAGKLSRAVRKVIDKNRTH